MFDCNHLNVWLQSSKCLIAGGPVGDAEDHGNRGDKVWRRLLKAGKTYS